jgi:hypothetical protein
VHVFQDGPNANSLRGASQHTGQILKATVVREPDNGLAGNEVASTGCSHAREHRTGIAPDSMPQAVDNLTDEIGDLTEGPS